MKWNKKLVVLLFSLFTWSLTQAQINIEEPPGVNELVNSYRSFNDRQEYVTGWRIQIVATTERRKLDDYRAKFRAHFPDVHYTEKFKKPYYRMTTGACLEKIEILPFLNDVKRVFPSSFIVRDKKIMKTELIH